MKNLKVAIIGCGYWGPNLVRNFTNLENCTVTYVVDKLPDRLGKIKKLYPEIDTTKSFDQVLEDTEIDSIVIATPVSTHYNLAKRALEAKKHVLVEKPMTNSIKDAEELASEPLPKVVGITIKDAFSPRPKSIIESLIADNSYSSFS